jgi:hypothetical protein
MVGASKILTVSYGTFSCTLEGFDEPFNTMKAIAEYFRDLAADDRYFGAEPPTPDAAMLHQIAEREMKRRVETKIQDNGVILRATDSDSVYDGARLAAPKGATPPKADSVFEDQQAAPVRAAVSATSANTAVSDSVAAKLSRIRNAMAETRASGETTRPAANFVSESAAAEAAEEAEAAEKAKAEAQAKAKSEAAEKTKVDAQAKAKAEDSKDSDSTADDDAILASLSGAFDDEESPLDGRFDDEDLDDILEPLDAEGDDTLMASLAAAMSETIVAPEDAPGTAQQDGTTEELDDAILDDLDADFDETATVPDSAARDVALNQDRTAASAKVAEPETKDIAATEDAPAATPTPQRARARVIKIRRAPETPAASPAPAAETSDAGMLSPEAEADLMRELAELEYDQPQVEEPASAVPQPKKDQSPAVRVAPVRPNRPVSTRRKSGELSTSEDDASVKRLLDQTNTELEGKENRRRLSAIAHLKAAVAATVADRKEGVDQGPTEEMRMNPYRNDLERAVRARPTASQGSNANAERPAPLMLVSEQRIDAPRVKQNAAQRHVTPVRPRRAPAGNLAVSSHDDEDLDATPDAADGQNIFDRTTSFSDYAEKLGAESLAELLEAAVAYSAHVQGHSEVTRPQMLSHVLSAQPDLKGDRETMLRSFGTLLREGRIEKVRPGHFSLSETSPIHAEALRAAKR